MTASRVEILLRERDTAVAREATNSPLEQGKNETVTYFADFAIWGASETSPCTSPAITCLDEDDTDVTSTLCSGGGSVVDDTEVQFAITAITEGKKYRIFIKATIDSSIFEPFVRINGER